MSTKLSRRTSKVGDEKALSFDDKDVGVGWNIQEKRKLLDGLRLIGQKDIEKLAEFVGTKSVNQVKAFIEKRELTALRNVECEETTLDLWIDKTMRNLSRKPDYSVGLADVISKSTQGSFSDIYNFVVHILKNELPPQLNAESNQLMFRLLKDLSEVVDSVNSAGYMDYVVSGFQNADAIKDIEVKDDNIFKFYKDGITSVENSLPSFNPLQISPVLLERIYLEAKKRSDM